MTQQDTLQENDMLKKDTTRNRTKRNWKKKHNPITIGIPQMNQNQTKKNKGSYQYPNKSGNPIILFHIYVRKYRFI